MKVVILEDYQRAAPSLACFSKLAAHDVEVLSAPMKDEAELAHRIHDREAVVLIRERTRVTASLLDRLPNLRLVVQTAKVGPHVDVAACRARGITVCDGTGGPGAPAELAWGLILAASRNLVVEAANLRAGRWQGTVGRTLAGRRLGLVGYGRIAKLLARYAAAFDMSVLVWGRETSIARAKADGLATTASMPEVFGCDVVSAMLRLNAETRGIIRYEHLAAMRPDALFVNVSRAELVEPGALERAIAEGRPGQAAVDVFMDEPLVGAVPEWLQRPNVTATPHIGFVAGDNYEKYFGDAFDAVNAFAAGTPVRVVA